ncbi:hypothetical protein Vretifemale_664, partial [Volvox reticuliferus]
NYTMHSMASISAAAAAAAPGPHLGLGTTFRQAHAGHTPRDKCHLHGLYDPSTTDASTGAGSADPWVLEEGAHLMIWDELSGLQSPPGTSQPHAHVPNHYSWPPLQPAPPLLHCP